MTLILPVMRMAIPRAWLPITRMILSHLLSNTMFDWFKDSLWKNNAGKFPLLISANDRLIINMAGCKIDKSNTEKLLGVKFDKS